jgi:transcriptional regulator with XRE-family HTH domain
VKEYKTRLAQQLRMRRGYDSQTVFGAKFGISRDTVSRLECGGKPSRTTAQKLQALFNMEAPEILGLALMKPAANQTDLNIPARELLSAVRSVLSQELMQVEQRRREHLLHPTHEAAQLQRDVDNLQTALTIQTDLLHEERQRSQGLLAHAWSQYSDARKQASTFQHLNGQLSLEVQKLRQELESLRRAAVE